MGRRKKSAGTVPPKDIVKKATSTTTYNISRDERMALVDLAGTLGYKPGRGAGAKRGLPNISAMMRDLAALCNHDQAAVANALRSLGLGKASAA